MLKLTFWLMFLAGWSIHAILQARASVTSKSNGLRSTREWFALSWQIVLARGFLAALAMQLWCEAPKFFGPAIGLTLAAPMTEATAGIFGYAADSVLDKLGAIFGIVLDIPKLAPPAPAVSIGGAPVLPPAPAGIPVQPRI